MTDDNITDEELQRRRDQFLDMISDYSERRWAAGWMTGIEHEIRTLGGIWPIVAQACGGWPIGYRAEGGWDPIPEHDQPFPL